MATKTPTTKKEPEWTERNGIIYCTVTSDGTSGPDWIQRLTKIGCLLEPLALQILNSKEFIPTAGVTYEVAILKGNSIRQQSRTTKKIRSEARFYELATPSAEIACLLREKLTDREIEDMGFELIIVMHPPILDDESQPTLLGLDPEEYNRELTTHDGTSNAIPWDKNYGFAFIVSREFPTPKGQ